MLAIVAAVHRDIAGFLKIGRFSQSDRVGSLRLFNSASLPHIVAATGGFGEDEEMSQSVSELVSRYNPEIIVSAGFASSVKPGLPTGEIIVCDRILAVDGPAYSWRKSEIQEIPADLSVIEEVVRQAPADDTNFEVGACLTLPQSTIKSPMKEWLGATFDVSAMDLDGYPMADTISKTRLPLVPIKVVMDTLEQDTSPRVFEALRCPMGMRILRSTRHVAANPIRIFEVARSAAQAGLARKSLARFLYLLARTPLAMGQE